MTDRPSRPAFMKSPGYEIFIGVLSILSIVNLVLLYAINDPSLDTVLFLINAILSGIFLIDFTYRLLNREVRNKWDFGTSPTRQGYAGVLEDIQDARAANRALEVFIAAGYTDLITPYLGPAFLVNQLTPLRGASPITIEDYAGGHMLYLRPDTRRALRKDVEAMYERALKSSPQG